ncbi:hypothetical protein [Roseospira visakhapatnamensis]|uniref:Uncharacterized protein n=1 Tax=Roseospira visakhapatnamensis TaxID=390880 RepID=A0A7W6WA66_9PROT|nr:hypothetical protein [Roseospira visakhapatnamensis]MBB4266885.1 hypothetical protein [Roseospira visakhapatnamensis]
MADYCVTYRTPTAARGEAVVDADGLHTAQDEALRAVHILTGHSLERIAILAVSEHPDGRTLWWDPALYTPAPHETAPRDPRAQTKEEITHA